MVVGHLRKGGLEMDIYIFPQDAKHTDKTNEQTEKQTAVKPETYTKEEVQMLLEALLKATKTEQSQYTVENILKEVE